MSGGGGRGFVVGARWFDCVGKFEDAKRSERARSIVPHVRCPMILEGSAISSQGTCSS